MTIQSIKDQIKQEIQAVYPDLSGDFELDLELPPDPKLGDLAISCFKLSKILKQKPEQIAKKLSQKIEKKELIDKIQAQGAYLNLFLNKKIWFQIVIEQILKQKNKFGQNNLFKGKKCLIEFSAPNTNKPQHLGHLRNNFLGWSVSNLLKEIGYDVVRMNLINDRGIHICKSMLAYLKWGKGETPKTTKIKGDHLVGKYYLKFNQEAKKDESLLIQTQEMLKKWEMGDSDILALWKQMNSWALDGFKQTYDRIQISFDKTYFESDTYDLGKDIIQKALKKGQCYQREDKAIEIDLTEEGLDKKVLIRPDGTSVYITQDIGLAQLRQKELKPDLSIYVVASEQDYHFKVLFSALDRFGFEWVKNCHHLSYGMVFLPDGKMKSREGRIVDADQIIQEMEQLAKTEILARDKELYPQEVSIRAEKIALAALKFYFLKVGALQSIHFNPEESISFEGSTGPYLQYVYARIQSILNNQKEDQKNNKNQANKNNQDTEIDYSQLKDPTEVELLKLLFLYPEIISKAALTYNPGYLANYLIKLGQQFNEFYHQCHILNTQPKIKNARITLIKVIAEVLKKSLKLLGIETLDQM